jgi:hypothetical protein
MIEIVFITLQFLLFICVYFLAYQGNPNSILLAGVASIPLYAAMAIHEARRERWLLSPLAVYLGVSVIYLGLVSLYLYAALVGGHDIFYLGLVNVQEEIPLAVSLSVLSVLCYYSGYKLTEVGWFKGILRKVQVRTKSYDLRLKHWLIFIAFGWLLVMANRWVPAVRKIGFLDGLLLDITCGGAFFLMISNYSRWKGEYCLLPVGVGRIFMAVVAMVAYVLFVAMGSGMRFPIITVMFYFIWGYALQQEIFLRSQARLDQLRSLAKPGLLAFGSMGLIVTLIVPYGKEFFRAKITEGQKIEVVKSEHHFYELRATFPEEGVWRSLNRMALNSTQALAATVNLYGNNIPPESPVHESVTTGIIPRLFWPEKPFVSLGPYFSLVVGSCGGDDEKDATTATASTAAGELYWSYGIKGLIIGMGLLGFLFGLTFKVVSWNMPANPIKALVSIDLVQHATKWFGADATSLFVLLIFIWVVLSVPIFIRVPALRSTRSDRKFVPAGGGG